MNLKTNILTKLSAITVRLAGEISDTGIKELDDPINRAWDIFTKLIGVGGAFVLIWGLVALGLAASDQDDHGKKSAGKKVIGGIIILAAAVIANFIIKGIS